MTTVKGVPALYYNGSKYLINWRNASGRIYWRYGSTEKCDGSVTKEDGVLIKENAEHTHPSSEVQALVDKVVSTMCKRAREEVVSITAIYWMKILRN